jgi:hypothetical protein
MEGGRRDLRFKCQITKTKCNGILDYSDPQVQTKIRENLSFVMYWV